ncbi:hypothetical protein [Thermoflexus sp.]|uniref:hypothetical protein n=1 Tax=Thermoflexus sp. TaxID=1969742 RepID=UPI002ADE84E3|nr:hypothetical protein [Thermoflexus sp.]
MGEYAGFRIGARASGDLLAFLKERQEEGESLGNTVRRMLEWLRALLRSGEGELRRALSEQDLLVVLEALNGAIITPETASLLWAEVADRLGDDHPVTVRVRGLSPAGRFALADLAFRFYRRGGDPRERLRELVAIPRVVP